MFTPSKFLRALFTGVQFAWSSLVWFVCVRLFGVCCWLVNSWACSRVGGGQFIHTGSKWNTRGTAVCLFVNLNMFACQRAHCLLTVRCCSSVEEPLSWLDSNGKLKVRLETKLWQGFCLTSIKFHFLIWQGVLRLSVSFYCWFSILVMMSLLKNLYYWDSA